MHLIDYITEHMELDAFQARGIILEGHVIVNGEKCTSVRKEVTEQDRIVSTYKAKKYVTRAGWKLEEALRAFQVDANAKICLDIGASEGGFTDCLLQNGAAKVYAVDVAYGILNWKLRTDARVVPIERTNARYLTEQEVPEKCDLLTSDVSFISIKKIIPTASRLLKEDGIILCLFKPQFELPREQLGKNGIPFRQEDIVSSICALSEYFYNNGIYITDLTASPIRGGHGNVEFLLYASLQPGEIIRKTQVAEVVHASC